MRKVILLLAIVSSGLMHAQDKPTPQVIVNGEGIVKVVPDEAYIVVSVENKGNNAADVKKQNDATVAKVVSAIKKTKLAEKDVQTRRVTLQPQYDYEKKKYTYFATQTISILLRDLGQYDGIMESLIEAGVNQVSSVEFRSSKIEQARTEARKKAMADAKRKADDYVSAVGQKAGKAITITDSEQPVYFPRHYEMAMAKTANADMPEQTLAIGEIEVKANVNVSFSLE